MLARTVAILLAAAGMTVPAIAADPVLLHAAGSLRAALTEVAGAFEAASGPKVQAKYGASGTLKDGPVMMFARNRLCALVRPGLAVEPATLLDRMLAADMKLGTSTPRADPSGDYAWEAFRKADKLRPGVFAALERKALQLVGGPSSPTAPPGRALYGMLVAEGQADIFLTYCTNARQAQAQNPGQQIVALPDELAVGADYGLTVLTGASPQAYQFAMFIIAVNGQSILAKHGFAAPALPQ